MAVLYVCCSRGIKPNKPWAGLSQSLIDNQENKVKGICKGKVKERDNRPVIHTRGSSHNRNHMEIALQMLW